MVSAVLVFILLFKPDLIIEIKRCYSSIFVCFNWWYISQNVDYFNQFAIAPLKHLWSLAIEEQFYVFYQLWFSSCLNVLNRKNHTYIMDCLSIIFGNDGNYFWCDRG